MTTLVHFSVVGFVESPTWLSDRIELNTLPREGEVVEVPGLPEGRVYVRTVVHCPWGDTARGVVAEPDGGNTPYVYVVLGPPRR